MNEQLPELAPKLDELVNKTPKREGRPYIILLFVTMILLIVIIMAMFSSYIEIIQRKEDTSTNSQPTTLDTAQWQIEKYQPSVEDQNLIDLQIKSSIGNLREYLGIRSFGLSNSRQKIVISNKSGLELIDLTTNTAKTIDSPFTYSGDLGDVISWSVDDKYFAFSVARNANPHDSHVLVFNEDGSLFKDISGNFAYYVRNGQAVMYHTRFSPTSALLLTRSYKLSDFGTGELDSTATNKVDLAPVYLHIYTATGEPIKEISVRDFVTISDSVTYLWNNDGESIKYLITQLSEEINFGDNNQFTNISVR